MRNAIKGASLLVLLVAVFFAAARAPRILRDFDAFNVDRVEVVGTRYLDPHEVLGATGITPAVNVFEDLEPLREGLLAHPLVADARIERRLGSTLLVHVTETRPVAFARTPELRAVAGDGTSLPLDLLSADLDLPVLGRVVELSATGRVQDSVALASLALLERLRQLDPGLLARTSEIVPANHGAVRLRLRAPVRLDVLLGTDVTGEQLRQLRLALTDVEARGELQRISHLDARFRDQVVVALESSTRK